MIKIALLGYGTVGSGVAEVLEKNRAAIERKAGQAIEIGYILDIRDFPGSPYRARFVRDFSVIRNDPEISVVVETMGGLEPAFTYIREALEAGKSVVTANKELIAQKGARLLTLAEQMNKNLFFEASVGGGIPIIKPIHQCLGANEISEIAGILNGTTNFILTKMHREDMSFSGALALAQELGYAERDPAADVEGQDACRKICILASLAFGSHICPDEVYTCGITGLTRADMACAAAWGGVVKLIARASRLPDGRVAAMVAPAFVPAESQLSSVDGVYNGILVRGDVTGDVIFYGKGAGKLPTASAVVSDVIDAVKATGTVRTLRWREAEPGRLAPFAEYPVTACLRLADVPMAWEKAQALFGTGRARRLAPEGLEGEIALITPQMSEQELRQKIAALDENGVRTLGMVRVLED